MKNMTVNRIKTDTAWRRVVSLLLALSVFMCSGVFYGLNAGAEEMESGADSVVVAADDVVVTDPVTPTSEKQTAPAPAPSFGMGGAEGPGFEGELPHTHNWSADWTYGPNSHWHSCDGCTEVSDLADHIWNDGEITVPATEISDGVMLYTCIVCSATKTEIIPQLENGETDPELPGQHIWSEYWTSNDYNHWRTCDECDEIIDFSGHVWSNGEITIPATEFESGEITYFCIVCPAVKTETYQLDQLYCGVPYEHAHTDACWSWIYAPEPSTEEPVLGLVCGLAEHVHDITCYIPWNDAMPPIAAPAAESDYVTIDAVQSGQIYIVRDGIYESTAKYTRDNPYKIAPGNELKVYAKLDYVHKGDNYWEILSVKPDNQNGLNGSSQDVNDGYIERTFKANATDEILEVYIVRTGVSFFVQVAEPTYENDTIYLKVNENYVPIEGNSAENPYIVNVGETFTVGAIYENGKGITVANNNIDGIDPYHVKVDDGPDDGIFKNRSFTALRAGEVQIYVRTDDYSVNANPNGQQFYVRVIENNVLQVEIDGQFRNVTDADGNDGAARVINIGDEIRFRARFDGLSYDFGCGPGMVASTKNNANSLQIIDGPAAGYDGYIYWTVKAVQGGIGRAQLLTNGTDWQWMSFDVVYPGAAEKTIYVLTSDGTVKPVDEVFEKDSEGNYKIHPNQSYEFIVLWRDGEVVGSDSNDARDRGFWFDTNGGFKNDDEVKFTQPSVGYHAVGPNYPHNVWQGNYEITRVEIAENAADNNKFSIAVDSLGITVGPFKVIDDNTLYIQNPDGTLTRPEDSGNYINGSYRMYVGDPITVARYGKDNIYGGSDNDTTLPDGTSIGRLATAIDNSYNNGLMTKTYVAQYIGQTSIAGLGVFIRYPIKMVERVPDAADTYAEYVQNDGVKNTADNRKQMKGGETITLIAYKPAADRTTAFKLEGADADGNLPYLQIVEQSAANVVVEGVTLRRVTITLEAMVVDLAAHDTTVDFGGEKYYITVSSGLEGDKIYVDNIKLGTKEFDYVEKDIATSMLSQWVEWDKNGKRTATKNAAANRYIVYVGDNVDVSTFADQSTFDFSVLNNDFGNGLHNIQRAKRNDASFGALTAGFVATIPGNCEITLYQPSLPNKDFGGWENPNDRFYIEVHYPIKVLTALGEINKDRVHEALDLLHEDKDCNDAFITDPDGKRLYIKNAGTTYGTSIEGTHERYVLSPGDELTLVTYASPNMALPQFRCGAMLNEIGKTEEDYPITTSEGVVNLKRITYTFKVNENVTQPFNTEVTLTGPNDSGANVTETFYIHILPVDNDNHFDIEISDGGTYTLTTTETIYLEDGSIKTITTVAKFKALVTGVNRCYVLDGNDNVFHTLHSDEYGMNGNPAFPNDTQFEYTSAYWVDGNGNPILGWVRERSIRHADVEKVIFNLQLRLEPIQPSQVTTIVTDMNGNLISMERSRIELEDLDVTYADDVPVEMNKQAIIDAYNKCPNHFGLDFTLAETIYAAQTTPVAKKEFVGGELEDGMFTFGIYDMNPATHPNIEPIGYRTIDADGNILFESIDVVNFGDNLNTPHYYYVKEIKGDNSDIIYDDTIYRIVVTFKRDRVDADDAQGRRVTEEFIRAEVNYQYWLGGDDNEWNWKNVSDLQYGTDHPIFYNFALLDLPATGAAGTERYLIFGIGLLITGFLLLFLHRRRRGCRFAAFSAEEAVTNK